MTEDRTRTSTSSIVVRGLGLTGAAILGNILVWAIALPVLGLDVRIPEAPLAEQLEELGVWTVIGASAFGGLAAVAAAALLGRSTSRARQLFLALTSIVLVLSLLPVLALDISAVGQLVLALMHVVVYAAVVPRLAQHLDTATTTG